jgi:catechol 2,3-dioxygenase
VGLVGHIGLAVRDLDESVRFYTEVLGMQLTERFEYPQEEVGHGVEVTAGAFVRCESRHHALSLFALRIPPKGEVYGHPYGLHHIAFEMPTPDALLAMYRHFRASGATFVEARIGGPGNQPRFYGRDPDGNLIEVYWGIDRIGWDGVPREYPPIQSIDLERFDFEAFEFDRRAAAAAQSGRDGDRATSLASTATAT